MFNWRRRVAAEPPVPEPELPAAASAPPTDTLFAAQQRLFGKDDDLRIVDVGAHHGHTSRQYLEAFPRSRVISLEPSGANRSVAAAALAPFGDRVELLPFGVSDRNGSADLLLTSHSGAHSLLEVGDMRFYDEPVDVLPPERIETVTLDRLCADRGIATLDILKMDIQGGELMALTGAASLLGRAAIRTVVLEVLFQALYKEQPMFWDLADRLRGHGYALQGLYEPRYHTARPALLCWADAIFVAPSMTTLPETP